MFKELIYLARYGVTGVVNTLVGFTTIFLVMSLNFSPVISNITGYTVGFILGFVLSKKFVFRSNGYFVVESMRYLMAFIISFLFNILILLVTLKILKFQVIFAQISGMTGYTLLMYIFSRFIVFDNVSEVE